MMRAFTVRTMTESAQNFTIFRFFRMESSQPEAMKESVSDASLDLISEFAHILLSDLQLVQEAIGLVLLADDLYGVRRGPKKCRGRTLGQT
jgi:hypothetical protein